MEDNKLPFAINTILCNTTSSFQSNSVENMIENTEMCNRNDSFLTHSDDSDSAESHFDKQCPSSVNATILFHSREAPKLNLINPLAKISNIYDRSLSATSSTLNSPESLSPNNFCMLNHDDSTLMKTTIDAVTSKQNSFFNALNSNQSLTETKWFLPMFYTSTDSTDNSTDELTHQRQQIANFPFNLFGANHIHGADQQQQQQQQCKNLATSNSNNILFNCVSTEKRIGHPYKSRLPARHKKPRTSFSKSQVALLETRFVGQKYLASAERATLASQLNMSDAQVKTWFQNRRTKWRRQEAEEREYEGRTAAKFLSLASTYIFPTINTKSVSNIS